jgi:hypothetical protein
MVTLKPFVLVFPYASSPLVCCVEQGIFPPFVSEEFGSSTVPD